MREFNDLAYRKPFGNPVDCFLLHTRRPTAIQCSLLPMADRCKGFRKLISRVRSPLNSCNV
uniref:Uncharacterized protein n=1 Tax=Daphnia galeata TaxID=27404 RepID=A0A8J2WJS0_9CRUS|nr:unnamed protein product [Daphnia galeata]